MCDTILPSRWGYLPSKRHVIYYTTSVVHTCGNSYKMYYWMKSRSCRRPLPQIGWHHLLYRRQPLRDSKGSRLEIEDCNSMNGILRWQVASQYMGSWPPVTAPKFRHTKEQWDQKCKTMRNVLSGCVRGEGEKRIWQTFVGVSYQNLSYNSKSTWSEVATSSPSFLRLLSRRTMGTYVGLSTCLPADWYVIILCGEGGRGCSWW